MHIVLKCPSDFMFPCVSLQDDFEDSDKEAPIESTFVRIKETPSEQESTVFFLTENGERAYTVNHETSHPPPSKVFVCDKPESMKESCLGGVANRTLSDTSTEVIHQIIDQVLQEVPGKTSHISEPSPESSILSRKDNRKSISLPIKKTVHFEADTYRDASCSKDTFYGQDLGFEGSPRGTKELLKQDGHIMAVEVAEEKPKQEAPKIPEVASDEALGDVSLADGKIDNSQTVQSSPSWNGALERAASHGSQQQPASSPLSRLGEDTVKADTLEIKVKLLTAEAMDEEDYFEGIPLKASKFNSDLVDFASTSQAFTEVPSSPEKKPAEDVVLEEHAEKLGKKKGKSAHQREELHEPPGTSGRHEPHKEPEEDDQGYCLSPEEAPVDKKTEVYEKAKCKSPHRQHGEEKGEAEGSQGLGGGWPSDLPSSNVSLETLGSHSDEGLDFKPSPPLSKISVIPHDLFYYPHYEVPLAAVLEAYAEGTDDLKNEEVDFEGAEGYLCEPGPREEEEAEASHSSCSFSALGTDLSQASVQEPCLDRGAEGAKPASKPAPPDAQEDQGAEDSVPGETPQVCDCPAWGIPPFSEAQLCPS